MIKGIHLPNDDGFYSESFHATDEYRSMMYEWMLQNRRAAKWARTLKRVGEQNRHSTSAQRVWRRACDAALAAQAWLADYEAAEEARIANARAFNAGLRLHRKDALRRAGIDNTWSDAPLPSFMY